jgi:hypothetical protein
VGKPSVVLGRLTWKWLSKEHLRCLVEAIKRIEQEKQATPKRELDMANSSIDEKKKQANHIMISALDHISGSQFIGVKNEFHY